MVSFDKWMCNETFDVFSIFFQRDMLPCCARNDGVIRAK